MKSSPHVVVVLFRCMSLRKHRRIDKLRHEVGTGLFSNVSRLFMALLWSTQLLNIPIFKLHTPGLPSGAEGARDCLTSRWIRPP